MSRKGFTLIELLVVISIVALLSSVVIASLNSAREKGRLAAGKQFNASIYHSVADSAAGIWDFDEGSGTVAGDRSGNGNDGTLTNGPVWSADTPTGVGYSLKFDGTNDYVVVPDAPSLDLTGPYTISFWFKSVAWDKTWLVTLTKPADSGTTGVYSASFTAAGIDISTGVWHHWAVVFDGTNATRYLDGRVYASSAATAPTATAQPLYIGEKWSTAAGHEWQFNGYLDEVRVFSRNLTASEVGDLYAEGSSAVRLAARARE